MFSPPQMPPSSFAGPPAPKRIIPGWAWGIFACSVCAFVLSPIGIAILSPYPQKSQQAACLSNLKALGLAALGYSQDYDEKLPPAEHWMESVKDYMPSGSASPSSHKAAPSLDSRFHCPVAEANEAGAYGYAFDSRVASHSLDKMGSLNTTLLFYDSTTLTRDASDPGTSLLPDGRHSGGNNITYTDGHVRWSHAPKAKNEE